MVQSNMAVKARQMEQCGLCWWELGVGLGHSLAELEAQRFRSPPYTLKVHPSDALPLAMSQSQKVDLVSLFRDQRILETILFCFSVFAKRKHIIKDAS